MGKIKIEHLYLLPIAGDSIQFQTRDTGLPVFACNRTGEDEKVYI